MRCGYSHILRPYRQLLGLNSSIPNQQWNCRGLRGKKAKHDLRHRQKPISVLVLRQGALPGMETFPQYNKYVAPSLRTLTFGSAALFIAGSVPQCTVDTFSLPAAAYECVAGRIRFDKKVLAVAGPYVRPETKENLRRYLRFCTDYVVVVS